MAIEGINITLAQVTSTAASIRTINKNLTDKLLEMKTEVNNLASTWQSDASTTIQNNFNSFSKRFDEYRSVIESYALFLDKTVTDYNETETAINNNAGAFK